MPAPTRGFIAVVCLPAALADPLSGSRPGPRDLIDVLAPVVGRSTGGVLVSSSSTGAPGMVAVAGLTPEGHATAPLRWFGPLRTTIAAEQLADWLAIGGPVAPVPDTLLEMMEDQRT